MLHFNSTMVQLVLTGFGANIAIFEFQFHYGSISSQNRAVIISFIDNFNSTMVQLVLASEAIALACSTDFNSTMVQLVL